MPLPAALTPLLSRLTARLLLSLCGIAACAAVNAAAPSPVIVGKNHWYYISYEIPTADRAPGARASVELISRLNRMLARNQTTLAVVIVPSKLETYPEFLPDPKLVTPYMAAFNDQMHRDLRAAGVHTIDLKAPFLNHPGRLADSPIFFRLDTHWTPQGAVLGAQAVAAGIEADPALLSTFKSTPTERYNFAWAPKKERMAGPKDILRLSSDLPDLAAEDLWRFKVSKASPSKLGLLGDAQPADVALMGSSFSHSQMGFPDALRYVLQRNLAHFAILADAGPWGVVRGYLQDDLYQSHRPKLMIWEIPERAMSWPPDYEFREPRWIMNNREWLLQVGALVQSTCEPAGIEPQVSGLPSGPTREQDSIDIRLSAPADQSVYLSAKLSTPGSKLVRLETEGAARKFSVEVAGDDQVHVFKTPLSLSADGVTRVRLWPGVTSGAQLSDVQLCRQAPEAL